jgi:hypothetical protein
MPPKKKEKSAVEHAGNALAALARYSPDTYNSLEKKCRDVSEKKTRANMRAWMTRNGFATQAYVGHMSGKATDATSPATSKFVRDVAVKIRTT